MHALDAKTKHSTTKESWLDLDLTIKVVWLAMIVQDNWTYHPIWMAEITKFIAKIAMGIDMDIREDHNQLSEKFFFLLKKEISNVQDAMEKYLMQKNC